MRRVGILNKLIRVYYLQMFFISVATVVGVLTAAWIVERVMIRAALKGEAQHFWALHDANTEQVPPNTDNLLGFLQHHGQAVPNAAPPPPALQAALNTLRSNFERVHFQGREPIVYREQRGAYRLYLLFDEQSVGRLSLYFGVAPLSIALLVIYLSAWVAYRSSHKSLSPLIALAETVGQFDPLHDALEDLQLQRFHSLDVDTEVRTLAEALERFTQRLQWQLQNERAFTRDVSHELRTPLAVIQGSLDILERRPLTDPMQQRSVQRMHTTVRDMHSIVETLLLLARHAHDSAGSEPVSVNDTIRLLIAQIQETHNADQHVSLRLVEHAPLQARASPQLLSIVIGNLVRNACNYTTEGSVIVQLSAAGVSVTDTGRGMSAEQIESAQKPFHRHSNLAPGEGLGLDIVQRLCERQSWRLEWNSSAQGTRVMVVMTASTL